MSDQLPATTDLAPPMLLERAITSGASIEVLKGLMDLQERWQAAQAKRAFDQAMAALRLEMPPIVKNQTVDFSSNRGRTHYKYEDLADVSEAVTPVMAKHGLSFRWRTQPGDPVTVTCIVSHAQGHSEECALSAPRDESGNKNAIQSLGSAITYLQRYTLKAALGVAAARDDDGNSAGQRPAERHPAPAKQETSDEKRARFISRIPQELVAPALEYARDSQIVPPDGQLIDWAAEELPTTMREFNDLLDAIRAWDAKPTQEPAKEESFWSVKWLVPPHGVKREDWKFTIKDVYDAMKTEQVNRKWFWSMIGSWKPEPWIDNSGNEQPVSAESLEFRRALDQFKAWHEGKEK